MLTNDIALCRNYKCTLRRSCYRYMAMPKPHWQIYAEFNEKNPGDCFEEIMPLDRLREVHEEE